MNRINEEKRNIVIFGAGVIGKAFYQNYSEELSIVFFSDNDEKRHGSSCLGLEIICPDELLKLKDAVIVVCVKNHHDIAEQLVKMGIKSFWLNPVEEKHMCFEELTFMDFSAYDSLSYHPNRIWLKEHPSHGGSCYALWKYGQSSNLDLLFTESKDFCIKRAADYYAYHTSEVLVTQTLEIIWPKKRVELWHGFTIKALWVATNDEATKEYFARYVAPVIEGTTLFCSYSKLFNHFFSVCTGGLSIGKLAITGMPRNDLLLRTDGKRIMEKIIPTSVGKKVVIYTPTFRESHYYQYQLSKNGGLFSWSDFDEVKLNSFLVDENILLLVKMHAAELREINIKETENVKIIDEDFLQSGGVQLYELLSGTDGMISDYSSIWVDYLLLNKPVIFALGDLEDYERVHGLMIEPFDAWVPGEVVTNMPSLQFAIQMAFSEEDPYAKKRSLLMRMYHKYTDGNASQRVLSAISNLCNK